MSTRATLSIFDGDDQYEIYRHHDGYPNGPHGVIHDLNAALDYAWPCPRFEAGEFAAAVVSVMKQRPGSVYLTKDADRHSDRNFHYQITKIKDAINVVVRDFQRYPDRSIQRFAGSIEDAAQYFDAEAVDSDDDALY